MKKFPFNAKFAATLSALLAAIIIISSVLVYKISGDKNDVSREAWLRRMEKPAPGPDSRPSEWAWLRRTFPHYKADFGAMRTEIKKAQQMMASAASHSIRQVEFAGPTNVGGRISDIEYNPLNPEIVYAGAATGGVFKSVDGGANWFPVFDDQGNMNIGDIGVDPVNPEIIYVGTGEANGGHNNFAGGGVYKSTDAGSTWQFLGLENVISVGRIVVDPSNPQRVFVAAMGSYFGPNPERGVYRSVDGGANWALSLFVSDSTGAIDIVIDPLNPANMMAAMWERVRRPNGSHLFGPTGGIYRTIDGGDNWELLGPANNLPDPGANNIGRIGLGLCQSSPNIVYALYNNGSTLLGIFKSSDFGDSWVNADPNFQLDNGFATFSWYFGQVRVNPNNPDNVFVLDQRFMGTTTGGNNWSIIDGTNFHVDHHALAFNPANPDTILEGNDGGINKSTNGAASFAIKIAELPVSQFYEIGLDFSNSLRLYGGTQDNSTLRTLTGALNDWDVLFGGDGFYVIVDPTDANVIYAESQFGFLGKSNNGGTNWNIVTPNIGNQPTNWSTPVIMDPNDHNVLYYGSDRVYRTVNGATSWNVISGDLSDGIPGTRLGTVTTIGVSPPNSNIIWAGTDDSHVWVTTDLGGVWTDVSSTLPTRWVTRVIPDPLDENICYVTFNGLKWIDPQPHVFRTANLGQTWEDISNNLPDAPVNAFAVDPLNPQNLFVGSDLGAYYSLDTGQNWQYLSSNFPMVSVYDMKIHPTANYLALGTHGRSMYKIDISSITGIGYDNRERVVSTFFLEQNYPNPFNPSTTITFKTGSASRVSLKVYDALGRTVRTLVNGPVPDGRHQVIWDGRDESGNNVSSGIYFYRIEASGSKTFRAARQMQLIR